MRKIMMAFTVAFVPFMATAQTADTQAASAALAQEAQNEGAQIALKDAIILMLQKQLQDANATIASLQKAKPGDAKK